MDALEIEMAILKFVDGVISLAQELLKTVIQFIDFITNTYTIIYMSKV